MRYSQNNEEDIIIEFFKDKKSGFFIEIGSYHPFVFSNVRKLHENGWGGVMIEPSDRCFESLLREYENTENITLIKKAVIVEENVEEITFYDYNGDAISTTNFQHTLKWHEKFNETKVKTISLNKLLEQYGNLCDFINIDVELTNYELFSNLPDWFLNRISLICIEHDNRYEDIEKTLERFNFIRLLLNSENIIMGRKNN